MIRNYLKTSFRSLRRNLVYTLINIIGLGIGFSGVILTFILWRYDADFDRQQAPFENIFRINTTRTDENEEHQWGITPVPLAPQLADEFLGIESWCRYGNSSLLLKYGDNTFNETVHFGDRNFFRFFNFPLAEGDASSFGQKYSAIISQDFSKKYFGEQPALGRMISVIRNDSVLFNLQVTGVLEKIPMNTSFHLSIIVPYDVMHDVVGTDENDWNVSIPTVSYIRLHPDSDPSAVAGNLSHFVEKNNELLEDWKISGFYLTPFAKQKYESRSIIRGLTWTALPNSALFGSIFMNIVILLIACFNFTNTAMAYARKRLKEIGIRKTFGGLKKQIFTQFMIENVIQGFLGLLIGMDIANIWIRWMNNQWPIQLETNYITDTNLIIFLILLLITVSFLAGAYPSLYIARFQPSQILKGNYKVSGTNALTRFLLTWQFAFSVIAVFSGIVLWQNARYQENLDWGFDKRNVIIVPLANQADYEIYRNQVSSIPLVDKVAGTVHNVSFGYQTGTFDLHGVLHNAQVLRVGDNYLETLGLDLAAGREFLPESENDINESIIVNEKFIDTYDINEPLSTSIKMDDRIYHIVGVVRDFYPYGLFDPVKPVIFTLVPEDAYSTLCVRADPSNLTRVNELLLKEWKEIFPNRPYEGYFQETVANDAEMINSGILKQFGILAIFALLLSSAGLFSLVSLSIDKKTKEIGIRKVMGASLPQIMILINKEFLVILAIASVLGTAMGYYFMKLFLADIFTYHTSIGPAVFVITVTVIILMALITSGRKIYKAAHLNPAVSLRYE